MARSKWDADWIIRCDRWGDVWTVEVVTARYSDYYRKTQAIDDKGEVLEEGHHTFYCEEAAEAALALYLLKRGE